MKLFTELFSRTFQNLRTWNSKFFQAKTHAFSRYLQIKINSNTEFLHPTFKWYSKYHDNDIQTIKLHQQQMNLITISCVQHAAIYSHI